MEAYIVMGDDNGTSWSTPISVHLDYESAKVEIARLRRKGYEEWDNVWWEKVPLHTTGDILKETAMQLVK